MINTGHRLKKERKRLNLKSCELAQLYNVSKEEHHLIEQGSQTLSIQNLKDLARAGIDIAFILTGERQKTSTKDKTQFKNNRIGNIIDTNNGSISIRI